jgi:hypothetical protein
MSQLKSFDQVAQLMGAGNDPTGKEKQMAVNKAIGEARGVEWVSCEPMSRGPLIMSRAHSQLYRGGPHKGYAVVS